MKTKTINLYKFSELSDKAKEKAINKYREDMGSDNFQFEWENLQEDAKTIGLKLTGVDIGSGQYCKGEFIESAEECAHKIEKEHGESCETCKTAKAYLKERDEVVDAAPKDENGDFESEYNLDKKLDELDDEFLKSLLEDYRLMMTKNMEYQESDEAIIETIEANDYDFNEKGGIE